MGGPTSAESSFISDSTSARDNASEPRPCAPPPFENSIAFSLCPRARRQWSGQGSSLAIIGGTLLGEYESETQPTAARLHEPQRKHIEQGCTGFRFKGDRHRGITAPSPTVIEAEYQGQYSEGFLLPAPGRGSRDDYAIATVSSDFRATRPPVGPEQTLHESSFFCSGYFLACEIYSANYDGGADGVP